MTKSFSSFTKTLNEDLHILESFTFGTNKSKVTISKDLSVTVDEEKLELEFASLEEAREYSKQYIKYKQIIESIDITIPEEKVASYIKKHYNIEKITDTLIESYIELASSNIFTVDPVVLEMKTGSSIITGKLDHKLNDGSVVAINETTQNKLNMLLRDRPEIVEYMRESKENFTRIVKEIQEPRWQS
jgi:hypothetical protein